MKEGENSYLCLKLAVLIEDGERHYNTSVNLPRYKCCCYRSPGLVYRNKCQFCDNKGWLSYSEAVKFYGTNQLSISLQIPQCHICTRFETEDNPLFAYSYFERNNEFKFIYRCVKGHLHDHGMILTDLHTGLEVYL